MFGFFSNPPNNQIQDIASIVTYRPDPLVANFFRSPGRIYMGRVWYIYLSFTHWKSTTHVGKHTNRPMDPSWGMDGSFFSPSKKAAQILLEVLVSLPTFLA